MKSKTTRVDIHHEVSKYLLKWRLLSGFKQFSLKKSIFFVCLFEVVQFLTVALPFYITILLIFWWKVSGLLKMINFFKPVSPLKKLIELLKSIFFNLCFVFYPSFYYQFLQKYFESVKSYFSPLDLTSCFSWTSSPLICFSPWSLIVFICFSNALPRGEYVCKLSLFHHTFFFIRG